MSDVDKVTEAVNNIAQAFSDLHGGSELHEEIARLKAKSAMQAGEIAKLNVEINNLHFAKKKLSGDLDRVRAEKAELKKKTDHTLRFGGVVTASNKELREASAKLRKENADLEKKIRDEREMGAKAGAEMANLREKVNFLEAKNGRLAASYTSEVAAHGETEAKLQRMQDANDILAKRNANLREKIESLTKSNEDNNEAGMELRYKLRQVENILRDGLEVITGDDDDE